jgi:hypothetical protein
MAKAQGKKASAGGKSPAKKVVARVKSALGATKKKAVSKPAPAPAKSLKKKASPVAKVKAAAKKVKVVAKKAAAKVPVKSVAKAAAKPPAKSAAKPAAKPAVKAPAKAAAKESAKPAAKSATPAAKPALKPAAVPPVAAKGPVAPNVPAVPKAPLKAAPKVDEKKRTRRPRLRVTSNGAPAAAWLSTEKPRPASFIPAPPRAEAPSAIAAPPASSDRLIRPEEVIELMVRTVPVRVDVEHAAGRFYVIANPQQVTLRSGEGIEWDFRYLTGADVTVEEIVIEFDRPSPFQASTFKTRKPGGARPHRQLSGPVNGAMAGKSSTYTIRAISPYKTEVANAKMSVIVTG